MSKKQPVMSHDPLADLGASGPSPDVGAARSDESAGDGRHQDPGEVLLVLPTSLTIAEVGEVHTTLMNHLANTATVRVDGSGVEIIDGAGLQLLTAFVKAAGEKAMMVTWQAASEVLGKAARQIGVDAVLKLKDQQPAA